MVGPKLNSAISSRFPCQIERRRYDTDCPYKLSYIPQVLKHAVPHTLTQQEVSHGPLTRSGGRKPLSRADEAGFASASQYAKQASRNFAISARYTVDVAVLHSMAEVTTLVSRGVGAFRTPAPGPR
jgi:hypothetical protein